MNPKLPRMDLLLLLLLFFAIMTGSSSSSSSHEEEMQALADFRDILQQSNPHAWSSSSSSTCEWQGIQCNAAGFVEKIDLSDMNLTGQIPATGLLGRLTSLRHFSLASNKFNSTIPPELMSGSNLTFLDLSWNELTGDISMIEITSHLTVLNVSSNKFSGAMPASIFGSSSSSSSCRSLKLLNFSYNNASGDIPTSLENCLSLVSIDLENCGLTGSIPAELGRIPTLEQLNLANNHLVGQIPAALFTPCTSLRVLDLALNNITGVPPEIGNCSQLVNATFSQNQIETVPADIGRLSQLHSLVLGVNKISSLPSTLVNCTNLVVLILNQNHFSGEIPTLIDELRGLQYLVLHTNNFTGDIPDWLVSNHANLLHLDLSNNLFTGAIPRGFAVFGSLQFMLLANNRFEGRIPDWLGDVSKLQFLDLSGNKLGGQIPASLGRLQSLLWLMLAGNQLEGEIPAELGNCSSLLWLNAARNKLTGSIPASLETMGRNASSTFQANVQGLPSVPKDIAECAVLRRWLPSHYPPFSLVDNVLDRARCQVFWNLLLRGKFIYRVCSSVAADQTLGYIQLSENKLSGSIPASLGRVQKLSLIFLYQNNLTGSIPSELSNLKLTGLNLSRNALTGPIPTSFGNLSCLQSLDLSFNDLNGTIPSSLQALTSLTQFNISYNERMTGPIPFQQQFTTFDARSYINDTLLCYIPAETGTKNPAITVPFCATSTSGRLPDLSHKSGPLHASTVLGISLACALGVIVMALASICFMSRSGTRDTTYDTFVEMMKMKSKCDEEQQRISFSCDAAVSLFTLDLPKQLTYKDLVAATGNFDETRVIGCGGFGIVYRAVLQDGSTVAVKRLIREGPSGDREFMAEMDTLGHVHHDHLVPLLGYSSRGAQKLLVYEYMENGSLEDWLHPQQHQQHLEKTRRSYTSLCWNVRLEIALGTARGLRFLHHSCSPAIIHRDMKASNILLDGSFRPRLTDFGLARALAAQEETHVSTIVAGTLGYVPPEYCQTWRATVKGDVYSFGVVLLELLSSRRPMFEYECSASMDSSTNTTNEDDECGNLVELASRCLRVSKFEQLFDPVVAATGPRLQLLEFLHLAIDCTQEVPVRRPCMRDVLARLEIIKNI